MRPKLKIKKNVCTDANGIKFTEEFIMAISIVNNVTAIGSGMQVNRANDMLSGTIKKLSTGLRINTAADDASGLAVSEKLRGQISGLAKAATNAQDATSLLQTAEASMGSMTDVLQRMRELAVQAGNPAYTTNDRVMLQLELDQLKDEIDRISNTTEFNTKKLLNGDAAAIWSSSSNEIDALVKGAVQEGDYKLTYDIVPGDNAIYKTNIMSVKDGALSYRLTANSTTVTELRNLEDMYNETGVRTLTVGVVTATVSVAEAALVGKTGFAGVTDVTVAALGVTSSDTFLQGAYIEFEALTDRLESGSSTIRFRVTNAETGEQSDWVEASINSSGTVVNGSAISTGLAGVDGALLNSTAETFGSAAFSDGDKLLLSYSPTTLVQTAATSGTIQVGENDPRIQMTALSSNESNIIHTIFTAQLDDAGNAYYGSMDVVMAKGPVAAGEAEYFILGEGDIASDKTLLKDLGNFVTSDGRNVLDNTQELTMYANGTQTTIYLEGSDTIADLERKLSEAVIYGLGLGADHTNTNAVSVNANLVNFVNGTADATANTGEAIGGSFTIQSALLGVSSDIRFAGDQNVINALGISTVQESSDSALNIRVNNAQNGKYIGEDVVTDNILRGIIENVEVVIEPTTAANVDWNDETKALEFTSKPDSTEVFLHLTDNATQVAIGANEGQTLDISIGRLDTLGLGIDKITVESFESAQVAITKIDLAIEELSATRAISGAQMNRLSYSISNLDIARENLSASESRIRDLDIAAASSELAAQQVLLQSANAMLAQANQLPSYAAQLIAG